MRGRRATTILLGLTLGAGLAGAALGPTRSYSTDTTATKRPQRLILKQGATERISWRFTEGTTAAHSLAGATAVTFYYAPTAGGWLVTATGTVTSATNGQVLVALSPANLNTNSGSTYFDWQLEVTSASETLCDAYGEMTLLKDITATGSPPLMTTTNVTWSRYTYTGTAAYGPYRPGSNVTFRATTNGAVFVDASVTGGSGDITAVAVSGGILSGGAVSGAATVTLTTNAVNGAVTNSPRLGGVLAASWATDAEVSTAAGARVATNDTAYLRALTNVTGDVEAVVTGTGRTRALSIGASIARDTEVTEATNAQRIAYQSADVASTNAVRAALAGWETDPTALQTNGARIMRAALNMGSNYLAATLGVYFSGGAALYSANGAHAVFSTDDGGTSLALGVDSAAGADSVAIGHGATAASDGLAIGGNCSAHDSSVAFGWGSAASTGSCVAIGELALASAPGAVQLGAGENAAATTLQFRAWCVVTNDGTIPLPRLSGITSNQLDATTDAAYRSGGGTGGVSDHAALSSLAWGSSGHTGTALRVAAFNASGAASNAAVAVSGVSSSGVVLASTKWAMDKIGAPVQPGAWTASRLTSAFGVRIAAFDAAGAASNMTVAVSGTTSNAGIAASTAFVAGRIATVTPRGDWESSGLTNTAYGVAAWAGSGAASNRTIGTGAGQLAAGDHAHAGMVTNGASGLTLSGTWTGNIVGTNALATTMGFGKLNGTNGVRWTVSGTNYWVLL